MNALKSARTLELLARVARAREIQSKHELARAIGRRAEQQEKADQAQASLDRSCAALQGALESPCLDIARLPLLQELSAHGDAMRVSEHELLAERERQALEQAGEVGHRTRYRERVEEKSVAFAESRRQVHEMRHLDAASEAWMVGRIQREST